VTISDKKAQKMTGLIFTPKSFEKSPLESPLSHTLEKEDWTTSQLKDIVDVSPQSLQTKGWFTLKNVLFKINYLCCP